MYFFHNQDDDFFFRIQGIWDNIGRLASIMLFHQIASFLLTFDIKFAKFLKYFNYIFFLIYTVRLVGSVVYSFDRNLQFGRNSPFLMDYGMVYELLYGFQDIYSLILLNICFVLSNIKDYVPKKFIKPIYVSIFTFTLGLFVLSGFDSFYDSKVVFQYQWFDLNKLNNIKLIVQLAVNFTCEIPIFVIIWIISTTDFDEDQTNSSIISDADLIT